MVQRQNKRKMKDTTKMYDKQHSKEEGSHNLLTGKETG
jgi:hypothetical protein